MVRLPPAPALVGATNAAFCADCAATRRTRKAVLGNQPAAEAVGNGLRTIAHAELAEHAAGVRLHGVLGQIELPSDLPVALAHRHAPQHLKLAVGELDTRVGRLPWRRDRGACQGVRE